VPNCSLLVGCGVLLGRLWQRQYTAAMTRALDIALTKLAELPTEEQDRIARWLLEELRDEEQWATQFSASQEALSKLATEVRTERAKGETTDLDPDQV